jgi:hypothetical protein
MTLNGGVNQDASGVDGCTGYSFGSPSSPLWGETGRLRHGGGIAVDCPTLGIEIASGALPAVATGPKSHKNR